MKKVELTKEELESLALDKQLAKAKLDSSQNSSKYKTALKRIELLERRLELSETLQSGQSIVKITSTKGLPSEATAIIVASDWHIEEKVNPNTINGLNKFTIKIAEERAKNMFINACKLIKKEQNAVSINTIILALLGDFFSGTIHEELLENRTALHNTAILKAQELLASGIQYLLDNTDCRLIIPCCSGNHSRRGQKIHISTEYENSYETLIYKSLEMMFRGNDRVQFLIKESYHNLIQVYRFKICFHHGHQVRYQGGVGGLTIPINKAIAQWNKIFKADIYIQGHYHTFKDGGNFIVNGSLIGYNAYAMSIKADYERPQQTFLLIDKKHGKTIVAPIFLEEK